MEDRPPLNWEASANPTNSTTSDDLPPEVAACLRNARFLHLATASPAAEPHISLMSHTYLPHTPFTAAPTVVMTTNPASRKTAHVRANPRVSLLVHDWVSPRADAETSPERERTASSSLASLLLGFNRAALGRISATVAGTARVVDEGTTEERWFRHRHLAGHGFKGCAVEDDDGEPPEDDGGGEGFLEGEDVRVVVVEITEGRIADWKGGLKDFVVRRAEKPQNGVPAWER